MKTTTVWELAVSQMLYSGRVKGFFEQTKELGKRSRFCLTDKGLEALNGGLLAVGRRTNGQKTKRPGKTRKDAKEAVKAFNKVKMHGAAAGR